MNLLLELRSRFRAVLVRWVLEPSDLLEMIRPSQDTRFGDYQANVAMPLGKQLGRPPREIAAEIVAQLDLSDLCLPPEIAGPGFINLRVRDEWIADRVREAIDDERLAVDLTSRPRTVVVDYSSPNIAKPMHVGHIRSTVIGDCLCRTLRFLGHNVIADNHLGDWGTQFGMIIYGFKHFVDQERFRQQPVAELTRLYKLVNRLVEYREAEQQLPEVERRLGAREAELRTAQEAADPKDKKAQKNLRRLEGQLTEIKSELAALRTKISDVEQDGTLSALAESHPKIADLVLRETAALHAGDPENRELWEQFLPACRLDIQRVYDRLGVRFDVEYGESFYQDRLEAVVKDLEQRGLARTSEGAICVFLDGFDSPMIIRKKDGAFLYSTTDLATIQYRMEQWQPDALLYVVDHRQSEHFAKLFAAARRWGYADIELQHISFGTVLGEDGRPYRTRSGESVGLEGLLDEAVQKARSVVDANDGAKPDGPELSDDERKRIAEVVGIGAIKYADLSHNRTSDYVFSYDKMMALEGNTATYMQYSYARVQSIFRRGEVDVAQLRQSAAAVSVEHPAERALALSLLRFHEALEDVVQDYRPNQLTNYLFELAKRYSTFFQECPVLRAESAASRQSRLLLCDLTSRTIRRGLDLLGIDVVEKM